MTAWLGWDHTIAAKWTMLRSKDCIASTDTGKAVLEIRSRKISALPPIGKQKRHPAQSLTVIHPCQGARDAEEQKQIRVEADHRSARWRGLSRLTDIALVIHPSDFDSLAVAG